MHRREDIQVSDKPKIIEQLFNLLTWHVRRLGFGSTSAMDTVSLFEMNFRQLTYG